MEIEAKYRILAPLEPAAVDGLDLTPYALRPEAEHALEDLLLDSAGRAITSAGSALRVRHDGTRTLLTFKGPGSVQGAVHSREELEAPLDGAWTEPASWPADIRARVRALAGDQPLAELARVHNRRRTWAVLRDGERIGELALDRGTISAGAREQPLHELEVELAAGGTLEDLRLLGARLTAALPLEPEPRSKLTRALALLDDQPGPPAAAPDAAPAAAAGRGERSLDELGRAIVGRNLARLRKAERLARAGDDPEGVHDLRVSTRRIRAALAVLDQAGEGPRAAGRLRRRLGGLAERLAEARDLDVFLAHLARYRAGVPADAEAGLDLLGFWLERKREAAQAELLATLDARRTRRLLERLQEWSSATDGPAQGLLVRHVIRGAIWQRYEQVLAYESLMPAPLGTLHELRLSGKRLRYTLEFFAPGLGAAAAPLLDELVALQDHLGELQDHAVAIASIDKLLEKHPHAPGLVAYREARLARQAEVVETLGPFWDAVRGRSFAARLAAALEDL